MKLGRPTKFTEELGEDICDRILNCESIEAICKSVGIAHNTLIAWRDPEKAAYQEEFSKRFTLCLKDSADIFVGRAVAEALDDSRDWYNEVNKSGESVRKPNHAGSSRSKLIIDTCFTMAAFRNVMYRRDYEVQAAGAVIKIVSYKDKDKDKDKVKKLSNGNTFIQNRLNGDNGGP